MPKFRIASDFHTEMYNHDINVNDFFPVMEGEKDQYLLLAGDIGNVATNEKLYLDTLQKLSDRFKEVFIVEGNHEYYHTNFGIDDSRSVPDSLFENVHRMNNFYESFDDVILFGATLWTDFNMLDESSMMYAKNYMNDFSVIRNPDGVKLHPRDTTNQHFKSLVQLHKVLISNSELDRPKKIVVLSHHAPHYKSVADKYKMSALNSAFYSDLSWLLNNHSDIHLWVHGHMHNNSDYFVNNTRIVCNPFGYDYGRENLAFDSNLVIDV